MFDEKFLNGVGQFGHRARIFSDAAVGGFAASIAGPTDLADAMTFFEGRFRLFQIEVAILIQQPGGFLLPEAHHLRGFFFQRHSRYQIFNALFRRKAGIFISWLRNWFRLDLQKKERDGPKAVPLVNCFTIYCWGALVLPLLVLFGPRRRPKRPAGPICSNF